MAEIGYFLSSEEHGPAELVRQAQQAEAAGFRSVWISDHYHPWNDNQGQSPFVWTVIGGIAATTGLTVTTGVTCPTVRIHPAILAQAAATASLALEGRFRFGVGSGENLNEHVLGDRWPRVDTRLEMLEEAVEVMRKLWEGGLVSHDGRFYQVENARIYSLPDSPPPVLISALGPKAVSLAARIGDGYISTAPDAEALESYVAQGGKGVKQGGFKVCWGRDEAAARKTALERWPNTLLPRPRAPPGELQGVPRRRLRRGLRQPDRQRPGGVLRLLPPGAGPAALLLSLPVVPGLGLVVIGVGAADHRHDVPEHAEHHQAADGRPDGQVGGEQHVGDDIESDHDGRGQEHRADDGHLVAQADQALLLAGPPAHPVVGRGGDQERRGQGGAGDGGEEGVAHRPRELGEALLEGGGEQERQQDLDTRDDNPQLLEQFHQLAVEPLLPALLVRQGPSTSRSAGVQCKWKALPSGHGAAGMGAFLESLEGYRS